MRRSVLAIVLLAALGLACQNLASSSGSPARIPGAEAKKWVAGGALLLDVRTPEEYADGHLDGAQNVPVDQIDQAIPKLAKDRPVVVYCAAGPRADAAARHLLAAGFKVGDLGPMSSWSR